MSSVSQTLWFPFNLRPVTKNYGHIHHLLLKSTIMAIFMRGVPKIWNVLAHSIWQQFEHWNDWVSSVWREQFTLCLSQMKVNFWLSIWGSIRQIFSMMIIYCFRDWRGSRNGRFRKNKRIQSNERWADARWRNATGEWGRRFIRFLWVMPIICILLMQN